MDLALQNTADCNPASEYLSTKLLNDLISLPVGQAISLVTAKISREENEAAVSYVRSQLDFQISNFVFLHKVMTYCSRTQEVDPLTDNSIIEALTLSDRKSPVNEDMHGDTENVPCLSKSLKKVVRKINGSINDHFF